MLGARGAGADSLRGRIWVMRRGAGCLGRGAKATWHGQPSVVPISDKLQVGMAKSVGTAWSPSSPTPFPSERVGAAGSSPADRMWPMMGECQAMARQNRSLRRSNLTLELHSMPLHIHSPKRLRSLHEPRNVAEDQPGCERCDRDLCRHCYLLFHPGIPLHLGNGRGFGG